MIVKGIVFKLSRKKGTYFQTKMVKFEQDPLNIMHIVTPKVTFCLPKDTIT